MIENVSVSVISCCVVLCCVVCTVLRCVALISKQIFYARNEEEKHFDEMIFTFYILCVLFNFFSQILFSSQSLTSFYLLCFHPLILSYFLFIFSLFCLVLSCYKRTLFSCNLFLVSLPLSNRASAVASSTRLSLELQEAKKHQSVVKADIAQVRTFFFYVVLSIIFAKKLQSGSFSKFFMEKKNFNYSIHFLEKRRKRRKKS